jgi:hypothetical protein
MDDFEKDEEKKLLQIEKDFHLHFKMSRKEIREEMFEFGNTLENFYIIVKSNSEKTRKIKNEET